MHLHALVISLFICRFGWMHLLKNKTRCLKCCICNPFSLPNLFLLCSHMRSVWIHLLYSSTYVVFVCVFEYLLQPQHVSPLCQEFRRAGGPRIKHVCRAAAVVLGQPRAVVSDDIPRLSALPLHERTGISPSPTQGIFSESWLPVQILILSF